MVRLTVGSLFSGVGGLDLGLERAGMEIRWQVEIDDFCRRVDEMLHVEVVLVANKFARHVLTPDQEEARLALYRAGLTDHQMAAALGLTYHAVKSWRQNRGLPAHPEPRKPAFGASRKPQPKAPTADPVTQAGATCDAMVRPRRKVISVDIGTGRLTVHRPDSWWPVWRPM